MADLSKLKRRSSLGAPPPPAEASTNLQAPEIAPPPSDPVPPPAMAAAREAAVRRPATTPRAAAAAVAARPPAVSGAGQGLHRYDGRSARRTGRTVQFATRVSPEFDDRVRAIAEEERILLVEVLERALDAYEAVRRDRS